VWLRSSAARISNIVHELPRSRREGALTNIAFAEAFVMIIGLGKIQKPIALQDVSAGDGLLIVEYSEIGVKVKSLTSHFLGLS
jgi:hypothetical protein